MTIETEVIRGPRLRAQPTPDLFDALRDRYRIASRTDARDLGGSSNLNLLVTDAGERFVVRIYRPWVTATRLADIQRARRALQAGGVPSAALVETCEGDGWVRVGGRLVEVERYVAHDGHMDSWERLAAGLPWLGRVHSLLKPLPVSAEGKQAPAANHVESCDALAWTRRGTAYVRGWNPSTAEQRLADDADELAALVTTAEKDLIPHLPRQLVHGDFWDNNVFFRDGRLVLVTDLDFMGERARIDDLALTLYYTNSTFAEDQVSADRLRRLRALVDAYDSGLDEALSHAERAALPLALARTPLCFIGMIASVDSQEEARTLAAEMTSDVAWALAIAHDPSRWQEAFASGVRHIGER